MTFLPEILQCASLQKDVLQIAKYHYRMNEQWLLIIIKYLVHTEIFPMFSKMSFIADLYQLVSS